jgi:GT2 family glycosyltransferase
MASAVDPSEKILGGNYPNTRLLLSKENLGFAGGNNWGMRQATGDFMFIVNNDTEVTDNLLDELLKPFYDNETIGVTCPKIKYFDQPNVIQYAGFNPMSSFTGRTTSIGTHEEDKGQHDEPGPTFGAHGCAMLVKKEVIDKVGMFPEKFFLYYEEWDWSARILKAGYKIWYTPAAVIYHKESLSVGKANPMKVYYHTRNRILYMRRNAAFFPLLVFTAYFSLFALPKNTIGYLARRQFTHLKFFLKGAAWNLYSSSNSRV